MTDTSQPEATLRLVVASRLDQLTAVKQAARQAVERVSLGPRDAFDVVLAVHETVVNAITHGNRTDPTKNVELAFCCTERAIEVTVRDEGEGFDVPRALQRVREPPSLEELSGRGLLLITRLMDEVHYNEAGNEVRLVKYCVKP